MTLLTQPTLYAALPLPSPLADQATGLHLTAAAVNSFRQQLASSDPAWSGQFVARLAGGSLSITHVTLGGLPIWCPSRLGESALAHHPDSQEWVGHWTLVPGNHIPPQAALVMWLRRHQPVGHRTVFLLIVRLQVQRSTLCAEANRIIEDWIDSAPMTVGRLTNGFAALTESC